MGIIYDILWSVHQLYKETKTHYLQQKHDREYQQHDHTTRKYNATLEKMNRFLNSKCFCIAVPPWIMVSLSSASPSSWSTCLFTELGLRVRRIMKEGQCLYSILTSKLLNRVHILSSLYHPVPISNLTCIVNGHHAWRLQIFAFSFP